MTKKYQETIDPESAYDMLTKRVNDKLADQEDQNPPEEDS